MHRVLRRALTPALVAGALAVGLAPAPAQAESSFTYRGGTTVLTLTGVGGDYITGGRQWGMDTTNATFTALFSDDHTVLYVGVADATGWGLTLRAPRGGVLEAGHLYADATRWPFEAAGHPGMELDGGARGCNMLSGWYRIDTMSLAGDGSFHRLDLSFEQHCEQGSSYARGHLVLDDGSQPAPPATAAVTVTSGTYTTARRSANVIGTVTCTSVTTVHVAGTVVQQTSRGGTSGAWDTTSVCGPAPRTWTASAPAGRVPFAAGPAQVQGSWTPNAGNGALSATVSLQATSPRECRGYAYRGSTLPPRLVCVA